MPTSGNAWGGNCFDLLVSTRRRIHVEALCFGDQKDAKSQSALKADGVISLGTEGGVVFDDVGWGRATGEHQSRYSHGRIGLHDNRTTAGLLNLVDDALREFIEGHAAVSKFGDHGAESDCNGAR